MTIEDALKQHEEHLISIPGVVGTGIGESGGSPVIIVMLDRPLSELQGSGLPTSLEGFPVRFDVVGEISAL